jgi:hypothetical protein
MCFVWLSEQTVTFVLYITNRLVFVAEVESVYCVVRSESLCNTDTLRLEKVKLLIYYKLQISLSSACALFAMAIVTSC